MKYLKKFEDLEYTKDDEFNYKKNLDMVFSQISSEVKIIYNNEVKKVKARLTADCINMNGYIKPIYGNIKITDDLQFKVYVKKDDIMLSIYKPNGIILDGESIDNIYRLFRKMSVYIGILDKEVEKIYNELLNIKDVSDYINDDIKIG